MFIKCSAKIISGGMRSEDYYSEDIMMKVTLEGFEGGVKFELKMQMIEITLHWYALAKRS